VTWLRRRGVVVFAGLLYAWWFSRSASTASTRSRSAVFVTVPTFGRTGKNLMADQQSDEELEVVVTFTPSSEDKVVGWRKEVLGMVYPEPYASWLAADTAVDLHLAVDLVRVRGCDPVLAYKILL
jgi:hypothetical protein